VARQTPTSPVNLACPQRHEGGHLLVPDLNELDAVARAVERAHDPVYPVAGVAVDPFHAPVGETLDEEVADVHTGLLSPARGHRERSCASLAQASI
jgi:hypothetical protein